jgi:hypothetical protein
MITPLHLTADPWAELKASMVPGTSYQRYGRLWRLARWHEEEGVVLGRIGFEASGGVAELWNEADSDFEEHEVMAGRTSPFAVRSKDLRIAFQLRPGVIRLHTFVGAFQALLNEGAPEFNKWSVEAELVHLEWAEWLAQVDAVSELEVRVRRPNPDYRDRELVEHLLEDVRASFADVKWKTDDPQGLNLEDDFVRQAIDHAARYGHWRARAVGKIEKDGVEIQPDERGETQWTSESQGVVPSTEVPVDPETGEARYDGLRKAVEDADGSTPAGAGQS